MAGDWIKMRHNLETDPDVLRIAESVSVDRFSVVGRLHMIWSWADQHSIDGCAISATTSFLDELVCCAGFCKALRSVGWLDGRDWELSFPNFSRHNGESAKKRAQAKKTMARKRSAIATNVAHNAQPEKRREEKSNTHTHPPRKRQEIDFKPDPVWADLWSTWVDTWEARTSKRFDAILAQHQASQLNARCPEKAKADLSFSLDKMAKSILDSDDDFGKNRSGRKQPTKELKI